MDDLKERLSRIEKQGADARVSSGILESSYEAHKVQNEKDFKHVDDCIHRSDNDSKVRDENIAKQVEKMAADILELKQFMWKAMGSLVVLVPLVNHIAGKFL